MKRLHLLRHAKSSWSDPALADYDRPLSGRGRRAAAALEAHSRSAGVRPQIVLCSPSLRTRQTLALVLPAFDEPDVLFEEGLYHASVERLRRTVATLPDGCHEAMLVGHNPALAELVADLALPGPEAARVAEKLPTGALVTLVAPVERWDELAAGDARIVAFLTPRDLGVG